MSIPVKDTNPASTRDAILDAAQKLFAEKGFADTSVSRIAKEAAVTKSLIHHYFGSKEQLWHEVKYRRFHKYFETQKQELATTDPDVGCLRDAIIRLFNVFRGDPELARLIAWHLAEQEHDSHEDEYELVAMGAEKLLEGQEIGHMRPDVNPRFAVIAFLSLVFHWFMGRREYLEWLDLAPNPTDVDEEYLETILKIFFEGILPRCPGCQRLEDS